MRIRLVSLLLVLSAASAAAAAEGPTWKWDNDTPECALFGPSEDYPSKNVYLTRDPGQDTTWISFKVRSPKSWKGLYDDGEVNLPGGVAVPAVIHTSPAENSQYEVSVTVEGSQLASDLAKAPTIAAISVAQRDIGGFTVTLRNAAQAIRALRACEDGKMRDWGIDVKSYWALASRPRPIGHLADLFSPDDYPALAIARSINRNVIAKLEIGLDGHVASCGVPIEFGYPEFVESVCNVLKKGARFKPAVDTDGHAVAAPYVAIVNFRMRSD